ncbi:response regulator [Jejudonia soesokkakensis]|uniref:histidine kinase n=1 Tax=Jejudonia soesokkakensis TaxID=1323432 RepID=A0ABW2MX14_9FLAO
MLVVIALLAMPLSFSQEESRVLADTLTKHRVDTLSDFITQQFFKRNYDKTIEFGELALQLSENENYYKKYAAISSFIGNAYLEIEDSLHAKQVFKRSVEKSIEQNDTIGQLISEIDFANFYALREEQSSKRKAIALYKKSIPLAKKINSTNNLLLLNSNISELYLDLEETQLASIYVKETEKFLDTKNIFEGYLGSTALNKARLLTQQGNYKEAEEYFNSSLKIFEKINYLDGIIDVFNYAVENAALQNDYRKAFNLQAQLDKFELEKYKEDKIEAVQTVTTRFKLEEVKTELQEEKLLSELKEEQARQETTFFWVKIASFILLLFFGFMLYAYIKRRRLLSNLLLKNKQYLEEKERSERLYKARNKLFSNITHELRTPMYGIIGISNLLLEKDTFKSERENLKSLKFSADYLLSLVNNILHFNHLENNGLDTLKVSNFDIRSLVYNVVETSKYLSEDHPNVYDVSIDNSIPNIIRGDEVKLSQILINLVGNASKFTNDGKIWIQLNEISRNSEKIEISFKIKDTGRGMDKHTISNIFETYSPSVNRQNFMGAGLGLPIVKKLLEQQNSSLELESEIGLGTTVSFSLSFGIEEGTNKNSDVLSFDETTFQGLTILVVDDNKINQLVTKKFVERYGANCLIAKSGEEAIEITRNEKLDFILMDINMPEMNGFEAAEIIRSFNKHIPIVALTAVEKEKVMGENSFNLMNDIIIKPYSNNDFLKTVLNNLKLTH